MNPQEELYAPDINEQLRRWDAGQTVWSIELGGLGPGYEQAIQVCAIECARATKDMQGLKPNDKESTEKFKKVCDEVIHKNDQKWGGSSGAQVGAATWLAWQWNFQGGPAKLIERCKEKGEDDRCIQISKHFPEA